MPGLLKKLDPATETLYGITLTQERPDGSSLQKIKAKKGAIWISAGGLKRSKYNGSIRQHTNGLTEHMAVYELESIPETPTDFLEESRNTDYLSSVQLARYIQENTHLSDGGVNGYRTDLHRKLSTPFFSLLAVLLDSGGDVYRERGQALPGMLRPSVSFLATTFYSSLWSI